MDSSMITGPETNAVEEGLAPYGNSFREMKSKTELQCLHQVCLPPLPPPPLLLPQPSQDSRTHPPSPPHPPAQQKAARMSTFMMTHSC